MNDFFAPEFTVEPTSAYGKSFNTDGLAPGICAEARDAAHRWSFGKVIVVRRVCSLTPEYDSFNYTNHETGVRFTGLGLDAVNELLEANRS